MSLVACDIRVNAAAERERCVSELRGTGSAPLLVLDTCQRLETFGFARPETDHAHVAESGEARAAFERLARIAAGLESRILGELEVLGQVRRAYKAFREAGGRDNNLLDRVFQDALSLARKARRESGVDSKMTSLSGLAARELLSQVEPGEPVAVIGSGSLASSVCRYLQKRGDSPIVVSSRCPERAAELALKVGGFSGGLDELEPLLVGVAGIISATAAPHPVLYARHLSGTRPPLPIIDLGEPADCSDEVIALGNVHYMGLRDIEERAHINTEYREACADIAARIIRDGAKAWEQRYRLASAG